MGIRDQKNRLTTQDWAAFGDPADAHLSGVTDAEGKAWVYRHNALGRLTGVRHPGTAAPSWDRTWGYKVYPDGTRTDLVESEVHPESGATTFTYDAAGRLQSKATPTSSFSYGYDVNDRLTSVDVNAAETVHDLTLDYDDADNRTLLQNSFVKSEFKYDVVNRLEWRKDTVTGEPMRQTNYTYTGWDDVDTISHPSGQTSLTYAYDAQRRVTRVDRGSVMVAEVLGTTHPGRLHSSRWGTISLRRSHIIRSGTGSPTFTARPCK